MSSQVTVAHPKHIPNPEIGALLKQEVQLYQTRQNSYSFCFNPNLTC